MKRRGKATYVVLCQRVQRAKLAVDREALGEEDVLLDDVLEQPPARRPLGRLLGRKLAKAPHLWEGPLARGGDRGGPGLISRLLPTGVERRRVREPYPGRDGKRLERGQRMRERIEVGRVEVFRQKGKVPEVGQRLGDADESLLRELCPAESELERLKRRQRRADGDEDCLEEVEIGERVARLRRDMMRGQLEGLKPGKTPKRGAEGGRGIAAAVLGHDCGLEDQELLDRLREEDEE